MIWARGQVIGLIDLYLRLSTLFIWAKWGHAKFGNSLKYFSWFDVPNCLFPSWPEVVFFCVLSIYFQTDLSVKLSRELKKCIDQELVSRENFDADDWRLSNRIYAAFDGATLSNSLDDQAWVRTNLFILECVRRIVRYTEDFAMFLNEIAILWQFEMWSRNQSRECLSFGQILPSTDWVAEFLSLFVIKGVRAAEKLHNLQNVTIYNMVALYAISNLYHVVYM